MAHDAGRRIDREGDDFFGRVVRDVLDVDAAFGRDHERDFGGFAVDQDREIELLVDVGAFLDVEAVDLLAVCAGLHRDQRRAQHLLGELVDLGDRLGDAHAALVAGGGFLELALAAAAGMDLALHHPDRAGKRLGGGVRIRGLQHRHAARNRHAELMQQRLGLVFVDIHRTLPKPCAVNSTSSPVFVAGIPYTTELQPRNSCRSAGQKLNEINDLADRARSSCRRRPGPEPRRPTCRRLRGPCRPARSRRCARRPSSRSRRARRHTCPSRRIRR